MKVFQKSKRKNENKIVEETERSNLEIQKSPNDWKSRTQKHEKRILLFILSSLLSLLSLKIS